MNEPTFFPKSSQERKKPPLRIIHLYQLRRLEHNFKVTETPARPTSCLYLSIVLHVFSTLLKKKKKHKKNCVKRTGYFHWLICVLTRRHMSKIIGRTTII